MKPKLPSGNEVEVLQLLAGGRELYGLEMIRRSRGALKRNSIYVVLGRMEDQGLIKGREVKVRIPAKATSRSDAWRPPVPIDGDQGGMKAPLGEVGHLRY